MEEKLALNGGTPVKTTKNIPMYPGGMEIGEEEKKAVMEVLDRKYIFRYYGPEEYPSKVKEFEELFAKRWGRKHALGLTSCTASLITAMTAAGVGPGSEVIIPSYTFNATCNAVLNAKAIPVICEIDDSLTMAPDDLEKKITERTKAIVPVHMRGVPCDMDKIMEIAQKHNIVVIEDVAQAIGGKYKGRLLGSIGDIGCFSLQYHKIITSGEGGVLITDNDLFYHRAQNYHDAAACWRADRFAPEEFPGELFPGVNYRMNEITGAIALVQIGKLNGLISRMQSLKNRIKNQISEIEELAFRRLNDEEGDTAICLIISVENAEKAEIFAESLKAEGVAAGSVLNKGVPDWHVYTHWRHLHDKVTATSEGCPYKCPYYKGPEPEYTPDSCPNTNKHLEKTIHIDIPPQMTDEDADLIAKAIRKVANVILI
ncbi:DegT/DnrJ/EryC1/StrS family aminotransferase [candidate division KSB1 bacterium]